MEFKGKKLVPFVVLSRFYNTTLTKKFENRKVWTNPVIGEIKAHLPGTIVSISVNEGQLVKKGELLMIHEAMKMENRILAPFNAIVKKICVQPAEKVKKDEVMIVLDPQKD